MNRLFLTLAIASLGVGCSASSGAGTGGQGGSGGVGGVGGQAGAGGSGGSGGSTAKCTTPQEMLRCDKVLNIAHRGGRLIRPEHTLLAYDQALEDGADVLELDIGETSDGALVVMHDDDVDRTTDCTGLIKEMTFDEIRECDAGYDFTTDGGETYPYRGTGLVVPTMQEVFDRYPDTAFIIEIKQEDPSIVDSFVDVIREKIKAFVTTFAMGEFKIIQLEEADYITPQGQGILRQIMEEFADNARFILTCNYET